jgi:hypothetical protein
MSVWTSRRSFSQSPVGLLAVLVLAAALSACGSDDGSGGGDDSGVTEPDASAEVGVDAPDAPEPDAGADVEEDGGDAGDADTGGELAGEGEACGLDDDCEGELVCLEDVCRFDRDADGVADDDDNCPEEPNPEQGDRDRDGYGDACDNYPSIHDPDNADDREVVSEADEGIPNDNASQGEGYGLELPFLVEGNVGPVEDGQADWDYYSFTITEPTLLLVDISAQGDEYWPGGAVFGYDLRNANVSRFILGEDTGGDHYREMFLPVPGRYTLVVTDTRNMLNAPDVGSADHNYLASVSAIPMPEATPVTLPAAPSEVEHDRTVNLYEVDVEDVDALVAKSRGVPLGDNSLVFPMLSIYDPLENRTLSLTAPGEADTSTGQTELTTKLGERDSVWVVEDFWQRFGDNRTLIEFDTTEVDSEFETFSQPQDQRADKLVWLQPDTSVEATIGPARTVSGTELAADIDYFLASVMPGKTVTFEVTPVTGGDLLPAVELGHLHQAQDNSNFYWRRSAATPTDAGEAARVSLFIDNSNAGELALEIEHAPNADAQSPEGGPGFEYTVSMELSEPQIDDLGTLPVTANGVIDSAGKSDFYRFEASAGDLLNFRYQSDGYLGQMHLYDADTFELIDRSLSSRRTMRLEEDREFIVAVSAYYEDEFSPDHTYRFGVEAVDGTDLGALPAQVTGTIDDAPFPDWYRLDTTAGGVYEVELDDGASDLNGRLRVYDADLVEIRSGISTMQWMAFEDGEVFIEVADDQHSGGADFDYTLDVSQAASSLIDADTPTSGQLADGSEASTYAFRSPGGAVEVEVVPTGSWTPVVSLRRGPRMLSTSQAVSYGGLLYYAEGEANDYAIVVEAEDTTLPDPLDFDITVTVHDPASATAEAEPNDSAADAQDLGTPPVSVAGSLDGNAGDEVDVFTVDLVEDQRLWLLSTRRADTAMYGLDTEVELYDPDGVLVASDGTSGEGWFGALYAVEVTQTGTWEIHYGLDWITDSGDYTLYVFTAD